MKGEVEEEREKWNGKVRESMKEEEIIGVDEGMEMVDRRGNYMHGIGDIV